MRGVAMAIRLRPRICILLALVVTCDYRLAPQQLPYTIVSTITPSFAKDLVIQNLRVFQTKYSSGPNGTSNGVTVSFEVLNNSGFEDVTATFRTSMSDGTNTFYFTTSPINGISVAHNASIYISKTFFLASSTARITIVTDVDNSIVEASELNNSATADINLVAPPTDHWFSIGPTQLAGGSINSTGKIFQVQADPINSTTLYATNTDSGGVWKTVDGVVWLPFSDSLPTSRVLGIALDPSNNARVYLATDIGIFRTDDATANSA